MEVITWTSADHGAIARIRMPMPSKGGSKIGWSPVVIHAETEDAARADGKARRLEKMAAARAAKTQQVQL